MFKQLQARLELDEGFTLIELLVVILIIGILAAIAIPSFLNQREKGQDACAKSQVKTMSTAMETYYTDNNSYQTTLGGLTDIEPAVTPSDACGSGTEAMVSLYDPGNYIGLLDGRCFISSPGTAARYDRYCVSQSSASGRTFSIYKGPSAAQVRYCGNGDNSVDGVGGGCKSTAANGW